MKTVSLIRHRNGYIIGLPLVESQMLLDELWTAATADELTWYQQWRGGDLIMWDNRCTLHRRDAFDESSRRLMHRTQITGERVLATGALRPCRVLARLPYSSTQASRGYGAKI
jgi:taurine dioxygenase